MTEFHVQLLQGSFEKEDAITILTKMVDVKIRYHEDKIRQSDNEEDITMRETRIRQLQDQLQEARNHIKNIPGQVTLKSEVYL
ncbi:MAG: hypothetical protein ACT6QS_15055 [Flavobacteriales bacterium]